MRSVSRPIHQPAYQTMVSAAAQDCDLHQISITVTFEAGRRCKAGRSIVPLPICKLRNIKNLFRVETLAHGYVFICI